MGHLFALTVIALSGWQGANGPRSAEVHIHETSASDDHETVTCADAQDACLTGEENEHVYVY